MTVLSTVTFNGYSEGATVTTGTLTSGWTASGTAFTALAAAAKHGARGASVDNVTSAFLYYEETATTADRVMSGYFNLVDNPNQSYLGQITSSGTNRADWRVNANGTVTLRDNQVAVSTSTPALSTGVWYRWEWLTGTGGQELRIYIGEGSTPVLTLTATLSNTSRNRFAFGVISNGNSRDYLMDTLRVADAWTGAFVAPQAIGVTFSAASTIAIAADHISNQGSAAALQSSYSRPPLARHKRNREKKRARSRSR